MIIGRTYRYNDLRDMSRDEIIDKFKENKIMLFSDDEGKRFSPAKCAVFIEKVYSVKTIRDNDDLYVYDYETGNYKENGHTYISEFIKQLLEEGYSKTLKTTLLIISVQQHT